MAGTARCHWLLHGEGGKVKAGRMLAMLEPLYDCPGGFGILVYFTLAWLPECL